MRRIIIIMLMILLAGNVSAEKLYSVSLTNLGDTISFTGVKLTEGEIPPGNTTGYNYTAYTLDFNNSIVSSARFQPPGLGMFNVFLPYKKDVAAVIIRDNTGSILQNFSVKQFAETCGNNNCEEQESYASCAEDCPSGSADDYCDGIADNKCDPDCSIAEDKDCINAAADNAGGEKDEKEEEKQDKETQDTENKTEDGNIDKYPAYQPGKTKKQKPVDIFFILSLAVFLLAVAGAGYILLRLRHHSDEDLRKKRIRSYFGYYLERGYHPQQIYASLIRQGFTQQEIMEAYNAIKQTQTADYTTQQ